MSEDIDVASLGIWSEDALKRLDAIWVKTARQVVAIGATANGVLAIAEQTGLSEGQVRELLQRTRDALPADIVRQLSQPADTSQFGRGAVDPIEPDRER